ncbi:hypothetical protein L0F63_006358 [Massospora cicadina]|nr:hypothetical protein L0F63_006358 [Massospora cicadina]
MKLRLLGIFFTLKVLGDEMGSGSVPHAKRRYDYKQSLKRPYKIDDKIPGFATFDSAVVDQHYIRLSLSIAGSRGSIWAEEPNQFKEWEVEYAFQISGRGPHGKDGLAFWYTQEHNQPGPVLGNRDKWTGLAIFHDTYDKVGGAVSPYILGIENDGTKEAANVTNILSLMFGGCFRDFRNSMVPVHVRVTYLEKTLKVAVDSTQNGKSFVPCFERRDINLPTGYYFGLSASSSHPADDHDLFRFSVFEANPPVPDHDMGRPFEKEGKFSLSKEEKEKVERLGKELKDHINADDEDNYNPLNDEHGLQETQFRILESLNAAHKKLEALEAKAGLSPTAKVGSTYEKLQSEVHALTLQVKELATSHREVRNLLNDVNSALHNVQTSNANAMEGIKSGLSSLSGRIDTFLHHGQVERASVGTKLDSVASYLWYVFLLASLGATLALGYTVYLARNKRANKKYI